MNKNGKDAERSVSLEQKLRPFLRGSLQEDRVAAFERVSSTMDIARTWAQSGAEHGTLIWARYQNAGRGRYQRKWISSKEGLHLSFILRPDKPIACLPQLSLLSALCVARTLKALTGLKATIRWPNDLFLGNRKISGILLESDGEALILGIGINLSGRSEQLPETAGLLEEFLAKKPSEKIAFRITGGLCRELQTWYDLWNCEGFTRIRPVLSSWMERFGTPLKVTRGEQVLEGAALDLDDQGRLLFQDKRGESHALDAGEVTLLRPLIREGA